MKTLLTLAVSLACAFAAHAQGTHDFRFDQETDTVAVKPYFPGRCGFGALLIRSDQTPGSNIYTCGFSNDWNAIGAVAIAFVPLTDGATVTWATGGTSPANTTLTFTTHGGSRTLNVTGLINGGSYVLKIIQDGTGGEGLTLGTGCTWKVSGGGSGAVTPSTGANAIDVLAFTYDGATCLANFNKNFN